MSDKDFYDIKRMDAIIRALEGIHEELKSLNKNIQHCIRDTATNSARDMTIEIQRRDK
jgi:hypothetical protein